MMIENLQKLSRDELVLLALKQGLPKPHHKTKEESIIKIIMDSIAHPPVSKDTQEQVVEKKETVFATKEQIEQLVSEIKARVPKFETIYDDESRCVTFRCNGAEDCMSMSVAPRWMHEKAKIVSRGRLVLRGHVDHGFGDINSGGRNAYTNAVLA